MPVPLPASLTSGPADHAQVRECEEETGVRVKVLGLLGVRGRPQWFSTREIQYGDP